MYAVGDAVEISYGDEWLPATVLALNVPAMSLPAKSQDCLDGTCTCHFGGDYAEVLTERWDWAHFMRRNDAIRPRALQEA